MNQDTRDWWDDMQSRIDRDREAVRRRDRIETVITWAVFLAVVAGVSAVSWWLW